MTDVYVLQRRNFSFRGASRRYDSMTKHTVANAMDRFVSDGSHRTGLFVGAYPTGFGKTYESCYFMIKKVLSDPGARFFFLTEQVKNLPEQEFLKVASKEFGLKEAQARELAIFLESNIDSFLNHFSGEIKEDIFNVLRENNIDRSVLITVLSDMNAYKRALRNKSDEEQLKNASEKFRDSERVFRKNIRKLLKPYGTEKERLGFISRHEEWSWLEKLYPIVRMNGYPIVFLTDKKYMYPIDPIVAPPFTIWSETDLRTEGDEQHSHLRDSVIIVDEFDTFKKVIQDTLIDDNNLKVDAVKSFRMLYRTLQQWKNLPQSMLMENGIWHDQVRHHLDERFVSLLKFAEIIQAKYHTEHYFKLVKTDRGGEIVDSVGSSFMFRDTEPNTIGNAFKLEYKPDDRYNYIRSGTGLATGSSRISSMFYQLDDFFNRLCRLVRDLAFNYMYNLSDGDEDKGSLINCVRSIIDAFEVDGDLADYIERKVLHNRLRSKKDKRIDLLEPSVYSRGFSYVTLQDSIERQLQTHLYYTDYDSTPEFILRHMCESTKVIGLSATGDLETPVSNFCLSYLRDVDVYCHELNEEEKQEIRDRIASNESGFGTVSRVETVRLDCGNMYDGKAWEKVFGDRRTAAQADTIAAKLGNGEDKNDRSDYRYLRFVFAVKEFLDHSDIRSMLCFFTAAVHQDPNAPFNSDKVDALLRLLGHSRNITINTCWGDSEPGVCYDAGEDYEKIWIVQIRGSNFESKSKLAADLLESGKKVLVVTAYQTLGAGQNLQYGIPEMWKDSTVWVRDCEDQTPEEKREKDYDAVYLDEPTHVAPTIEYGKRESLDSYLFFVESMDASCQITLDDKRKQIGRAFTTYYSKNDRVQPMHFMDTDVYRLAKSKVVKQALGRCCRTGWKNRVVYFFLAPGLIDSGTFSLPEKCYGEFSNLEFREVYRKCYKEVNEKPEKAELLRVNAGVRMAHSLVSLLNDTRIAMYGGDPVAIGRWKDWRGFVLRHPTASEDLIGEGGFTKYALTYGYMKTGVPVSGYEFGISSDFTPNSTDGLTISLQKHRSNRENSKLIWSEVSGSVAKLDLMLKIPGVREFMESNGYATEFVPNTRIMVPPLFRNIYMGGLGEAVGKFLIERDCETTLCDMEPENFEQFDYRLPNGVPVDLKDWNESVQNDADAVEKLLSEIDKKMVRCNALELIVVNVVAGNFENYETKHTYLRKEGRKIHVIPYLYGIRGNRNRSNDEGIHLISEVARYE